MCQVSIGRIEGDIETRRRGAEEGQKVGGVPFLASCANEGAGPLRVPFTRPVCESCSRRSRGWGRKGGVRWRVREGGERDRGTNAASPGRIWRPSLFSQSLIWLWLWLSQLGHEPTFSSAWLRMAWLGWLSHF